MEWLSEPFSHSFMVRAALSCVLVGFLNGFLGTFVVLRRLALMADSLSHSLLPGLAVGVMLFGLAPLGLFVGALGAALVVALGAQLLSRGTRIKEDTALGILYTVAFSVGVVLLSVVRTRVSLVHYLFGNILGVSNQDLAILYGIALSVLPVLVGLQRPLLLTLLDPMVARAQGIRVGVIEGVLTVCLVLTMIGSLQAVGVIMLLGLLIAPAATVYLLCDSYTAMLWGGAGLGAFGAFGGLLLSYWIDAPSGACIVLLLGALFLLAYLFSPRYGVLTKYLRRGHFHDESLARWSADGHDHDER